MSYLKKWKDLLLGSLLNSKTKEERSYLYLTLIVGVLTGVVAVTLQKLTHALTHLIGTDMAFDWKALGLGGLFIFISGYLTTRHFPSTAGSGIPDVRVSLAVFHGRLRFKDTIAKFITSVLSLSSGFSLGLEGPTVRVSSGIGSLIGNFFSLSKKRMKSLVAVASAGGIAAAFNTPIAAVIFTLEEVVGDLNAKMLGPIIISSVVAAVTASYFMGDYVTFTKLSYHLNDHREFLIYLVVGLAGAFLGPLWMNSVLALRKLNLKIFKGHKLTIIMSTFFIMALFSHIDTNVLGGGKEKIVEVLLSLVTDWKVLLALFFLKFVATTLCYSSGASGGLFFPTLFMGATMGALIGALAKVAFPGLGIHIGAYALVGMGAFFVSVIRAPFTSIIIVFEMTQNYNIILPLMVANITSYFLSSKYSKGSIYEKITEQDGVHLPTREDDEVLENLLVEDAMIKDVITLSSTLKIKDAAKQVTGSEISGYPVLKNGKLFGMVSTREIRQALEKGWGNILLEEMAQHQVYSIYPDQSLLMALHKLNKFQVSRLPVVSRVDDTEIKGLITAENIVSLFGYHIQEDSKKDLLKEFES